MLLTERHGRHLRRRKWGAFQENPTESCTPIDPMSHLLLLVSLKLNFVRKINVAMCVLLLWKRKQGQYLAGRPQRSWLYWNLKLIFIYLFTNFSGHRPAQREWARMGLRSHVRCHPYPIPQPVKVGHTTRVYNPYSFRIVMWVLLCPTRTNQWKCCETGPTVLRPYPRRLESLTICRSHYKGSTFSSVI